MKRLRAVWEAEQAALASAQPRPAPVEVAVGTDLAASLSRLAERAMQGEKLSPEMWTRVHPNFWSNVMDHDFYGVFEMVGLAQTALCPNAKSGAVSVFINPSLLDAKSSQTSPS